MNYKYDTKIKFSSHYSSLFISNLHRQFLDLCMSSACIYSYEINERYVVMLSLGENVIVVSCMYLTWTVNKMEFQYECNV